MFKQIPLFSINKPIKIKLKILSLDKKIKQININNKNPHKNKS